MFKAAVKLKSDNPIWLTDRYAYIHFKFKEGYTSFFPPEKSVFLDFLWIRFSKLIFILSSHNLYEVNLYLYYLEEKCKAGEAKRSDNEKILFIKHKVKKLLIF